MKKIYWSVFIFSLSILSWNCRHRGCPPDKMVGNIDLDSTTKTFIPYSGDELLLFKNANGDSLILFIENGKEDGTNQICVKEICTESKIKGNTTCEFFASKYQRFIFKNTQHDALMDLLFVTENLRKNEQLFYDYFRLGWSYKNFISQAGWVTKVRFPETYSQNEIAISKFFLETSSITLNGKTFENVFAFEEEIMKFYFSKTQGLLGFKTENEVWHLEKIE